MCAARRQFPDGAAPLSAHSQHCMSAPQPPTCCRCAHMGGAASQSGVEFATNSRALPRRRAAATDDTSAAAAVRPQQLPDLQPPGHKKSIGGWFGRRPALPLILP